MSKSKTQMNQEMLRFLLAFTAVIVPLSVQAADPQAAEVSFEQNDNNLQLVVGGRTVAEYVFNDKQILRPYFRHLHTLSGKQVTRNSPPVPTEDLDDHATMHPGLWLAFGDLNGADCWRNMGRVTHGGFVRQPQGGTGRGSFSVRNLYEAHDQMICTEECEITVAVRPDGYRLDWTSTFRSKDDDFTFGDQEEMGLGVRVATSLAVIKGGEITDSEGRKNGKQVWGQQSDWCEYGGMIEGQRVGVALMPDPRNFRRSWFHARDYGLLVANPFGQNAFTKGEKSRLVVPKGRDFQLRFGVLIYETTPKEPVQVAAAYEEFVKGNTPQP